MKVSNVKKYNFHVRLFRQRLSLTQSEVAKRAGLTLRAYIYIENGQVLPSVYTALNIAEALNDTVERIFQQKKYKYYKENSTQYIK